jgi:hypothetical protein
MSRLITAILILFLFTPVVGAGSSNTFIKPALAPTPPMGWNSWEAFRKDVDESKIESQADAMVELGLRDAGYRYLVIDGGWKTTQRDAAGNLVPDPKKFPHGLKALSDYVHSKGLKFGLHQPAGIYDCGKDEPGSQNNEERDAAFFASMNVDLIKYDQCDYIHADNTTPGSPDLDKIVIRNRDAEVFSTEAESPQNKITGLARIEGREHCSAGKCVAGIGYDNAALIIPKINIPAPGRYTLDIHFSHPYFGQNRDHFKQMTLFVRVNNSDRRRIDIPYAIPKRYQPGVTSVDIDLSAGVNSITFDNPTSQEEDVRQSYMKMAAALNGTGREIMFSTSGAPRPWLWAKPIAHLYRTSGDIADRWPSIVNTLDRHIDELRYTEKDFWPDPDMLEAGAKTRPEQPGNRRIGMTDAEYRAQFSLWTIMNAPLFISADLRKLDDATKKVILNRDALAINQDPLAAPCRCVKLDGDIQVFAKPLAGGDVAIAILNRGDSPAEAHLSNTDLGIGLHFGARNLWTGETTEISNGQIAPTIGRHETVILRLSPAK